MAPVGTRPHGPGTVESGEKMAKHAGHLFPKPPHCHLLFAVDPDEGIYFWKAMKSRGFCKRRRVSNLAVVFHRPDGGVYPNARQYFARVRTIRRSSPCGSGGKPTAYTSTRSTPAIAGAGYKSIRIDLVEHNEYIMDRVIGEIRRAPFLVADFTGHRNGVYYEAGFARGIGIPVIHCCRADVLIKAHFDTKQLNHVQWTTHQELKERLLNRIKATIGMGPYPPDSGILGGAQSIRG